MTAKTCTVCGKPILMQIFKNTGVCSNACKKAVDTRAEAEEPYLYATAESEARRWNPQFWADARCANPDCQHPYYRHFDTYEDMAPIGCKYCPCSHFEEVADA